MLNTIFVYGSLMGSVNSKMALMLRANGQFLGEAWVKGIIYDLGRYPGLVQSDKAPDKVFGHVFLIHDPVYVLDQLDRYEGIDPSTPDSNEYNRSPIKVYLKEEELSCWAYLYKLPTKGLKRIVSGNYLEYLKGNPDYQRFVDSA